MYHIVFSQLSLDNVLESEVGQPISMVGYNKAQIDALVVSIEGPGSPSVTLSLEGSVDSDEWTALAGFSTTVPGIGYGLGTAYSSIAVSRVRLRVLLAGGATSAVVSAGVCLSKG